jgi:DNA-binding FadR family transcriptional regulator
VEAVRAAAAAPRDDRDPSGFVGHLDFHTTLLMATGNLMITLMGQPVNDVLRTRLRRAGIEAREWDKVDACHRDIAEHVAEGRASEAEEAMRDHIVELRRLYERDGIWA